MTMPEQGSESLAIVWGIVCQGHTVLDVCQRIRAALGTTSRSWKDYPVISCRVAREG